MFTGIIENMGLLEKVQAEGTNLRFVIRSPISHELRVDQSLAHNGVCLTVEHIDGDRHTVTAINETIAKTTLGEWREGEKINLERCLRPDGRLDGHIVQGHVDTVGECIARSEQEGSVVFRFRYPESFYSLIVEKGSICLNGISLTVFDCVADGFSVAIIPFTLKHTNMGALQPGSKVNLEFDIIGKYALRAREVPGIQSPGIH